MRKLISLAVACVTTVSFSGSALATITCTDPGFSSQLVVKGGSFTFINVVKDGCNMYISHDDVGIFKFDLCQFNATGVPLQADNIFLGVSPGVNYHAMQIVTNPDTKLSELWVSDKRGFVRQIDKNTGLVIPGQSFPIGGLGEGLSYAAGLRGYTVAAVRNFIIARKGEIVEVDLATGMVSPPIGVVQRDFLDHISWEVEEPDRFLFISGFISGRALLLDEEAPVGSNICSLASVGAGIDGVSFVPRKAIKAGIVLPQAWYNHNDGRLIVFNVLPRGLPASCARSFSVPCQGDERGDGVGAPGDGFLYVVSKTQVNRIDPPGGVTEFPAFLMPGSSPEANFYVAVNGFLNQGCFKNEGFANSLITRLNDVVRTMNAGNTELAKRKLKGEILASLERGAQRQITCPQVVDVLRDHLLALIGSL